MAAKCLNRFWHIEPPNSWRFEDIPKTAWPRLYASWLVWMPLGAVVGVAKVIIDKNVTDYRIVNAAAIRKQLVENAERDNARADKKKAAAAALAASQEAERAKQKEERRAARRAERQAARAH